MPSVAPETLQQLSENIEIAQIGAKCACSEKVNPFFNAEA